MGAGGGVVDGDDDGDFRVNDGKWYSVSSVRNANYINNEQTDAMEGKLGNKVSNTTSAIGRLHTKMMRFGGD